MLTRKQAYRRWYSIKKRCEQGYATLSSEWQDFNKFYEWFAPKWFEGCHIDKDSIDPKSKIYGPETCKVITATENIYEMLERTQGTFKRNSFIAKWRYNMEVKLKKIFGSDEARIKNSCIYEDVTVKMMIGEYIDDKIGITTYHELTDSEISKYKLTFLETGKHDFSESWRELVECHYSTKMVLTVWIDKDLILSQEKLKALMLFTSERNREALKNGIKKYGINILEPIKKEKNLEEDWKLDKEYLEEQKRKADKLITKL